MASLETLAEWMAELGPELDLAEVGRSEAGNVWLLARDEATVVDAEYREEGERLYLSADLAPIPAAQAQSLYECALQFNFLWMDTGLVLAVAAGNLVLQHACDAATLDAESLRARVVALLEQVDAWREAIAGLASAQASAAPDLSAFQNLRA